MFMADEVRLIGYVILRQYLADGNLAVGFQSHESGGKDGIASHKPFCYLDHRSITGSGFDVPENRIAIFVHCHFLAPGLRNDSLRWYQ
jgi:hypothetical protein